MIQRQRSPYEGGGGQIRGSNTDQSLHAGCQHGRVSLGLLHKECEVSIHGLASLRLQLRAVFINDQLVDFLPVSRNVPGDPGSAPSTTDLRNLAETNRTEPTKQIRHRKPGTTSETSQRERQPQQIRHHNGNHQEPWHQPLHGTMARKGGVQKIEDRVPRMKVEFGRKGGRKEGNIAEL